MTDQLTLTPELPVTEIKPAKDNLRRKLGDLTELVASVKTRGILEPLVVTPNGSGYLVVAGARRLAAAKKAGLETVPVRILAELDDGARAELMLIENLQREDLSPLEEAAGYARLVELTGATQRQLAERIGRSQAHVSKRLALLDLPKPAVKALDSGRITVADAVDLTKLAAMPKRLEKALNEGTSGSSWRSIPQAVEEQLRDHRRAEKRGKVVQDLKDRGVKILTKRPEAFSNEPPVLIAGGYYASRLPHVDPKKHAKELCHAAWVDADGDVLLACLDPGAHPAPKGSDAEREEAQTAKADRAQKREAAHRQALADRDADRAEAVRRILAKKSSRAAAFELVAAFVVDELLEGFHDEHEEVLWAWLGLTEEVEGEVMPVDGGGLEKWIESEPDGKIKAAIGLALAAGETSLGRRMFRTGGPRPAPRFLAFLEQQGYELSKAERRELEGKAPA